MSATASSSGTFRIGGDLEVTRLGFGAMRITGEGIWGPPKGHDAAIAVLRRLPELGVDLIDTADSYGPGDSENLIHEALHPFDGVHVATKGGFTRHGPNVWAEVGRPELRQCCLMSLRLLPIPGTGSLEHLEENVAAAELELTPDVVSRLDKVTA